MDGSMMTYSEKEYAACDMKSRRCGKSYKVVEIWVVVKPKAKRGGI